MNGRDFSLQGLMGRDCRLLAGLVSVLCKRQKHKYKNNFKMRFVIYTVNVAEMLVMCTE